MALMQGYGGRGAGSGGAGPIRMGFTANPDAGEQGAWQLYGQQQAADQQRQRDAAQFGFQQNLQRQQADAEAARQAQQLGFQREQLAQQGALSRAQIDASLAPLRFQQQKFQTLLPMAQQALQGAGNYFQQYQGPGFAQRPQISDAPVYSDQMIQQQVNATRAQNDAQTAGQQRGVAQQMAGRGYGSNSPLAAALSNQLAMGNLATNTANEQDLRWKAASGNASQRLEAQKAQAVQALGYEGEQTKRGQIAASQQNAILAALLGAL